MIVRIIIILLCLVFFINGCNSLISQFFGTHKLRSFEMAEVAEKGIGDADYVEITNARFEPDFVYQEAEEPGSPPIILYPVFAESSPAQTPALLAWTADFFDPCVEADTCIAAGTRTLRGVVRPLPDANLTGLDRLKEKGYSWESPVIVINENEAPVAWYWNALMMLGAGLVAIGMEAFYNRKKA
ncbi:hypothetical protein [Phaeodactylibacter xiamenensis]|uniref:hypothetical protein n=1 Tax=Phaeodactylibacter xiamenensis TaxID=1524460 RepID=UPI0024A89C63|nr:hypothetical protein [Phaeodactylibacter xiamenensis]